MTLSATDLTSLQNILKNLTKELKKFSIDKETMKSHAAEYLAAEKEKEDQKRKGKYEALKRSYKATQSDVYNLIEELCDGFTRNSLFSEDVDEDDNITWYGLEEYLQDNHKPIIDKWKVKLDNIQKELTNDFMSVLSSDKQPVPKKKA